MSITLAMFDMAATTVDDTIDGRPLVLQSFADSFAAAGVAVPWEALNAQRGKDKLEVFHTLLGQYGGMRGVALEHTARALLGTFTTCLLENVVRLREMPGATAAFACLKEHGVFVALGSGFPLAVTHAIAEHLGWYDSGLVDYVTCGEAAGGGRFAAAYDQSGLTGRRTALAGRSHRPTGAGIRLPAGTENRRYAAGYRRRPARRRPHHRRRFRDAKP